MKKILIVEDERPLAEAVQYSLSREGYGVEIEQDGVSGLERFNMGGIDFVILDLMLPEMDGLEVCRRIRAGSAVPILILTAKDSELDEVLGLEIGADDYVTKPFNMHNLIARVKAILRRVESDAGREKPEKLQWGEIAMDLETHEVYVRDKPVHLTPIEFRVLELFMGQPRKVFGRQYILNRVWEDGFYGSPKTLDVHIRHLREKVEQDPNHPVYVKTIRGTGYRLDGPVGN